MGFHLNRNCLGKVQLSVGGSRYKGTQVRYTVRGLATGNHEGKRGPDWLGPGTAMVYDWDRLLPFLVLSLPLGEGGGGGAKIKKQKPEPFSMV